MKTLLSALAILFLLASPGLSAQKTITVGTAGSPASLDTNFGNAQDNFTEVYSLLRPPWAEGLAYLAGDLATFGDKIYLCKENHLSATATNKPESGTVWTNAWFAGIDPTVVPLTAEVDGSITNEIQTLSIAGDQLSLTDGGTVTIPAGTGSAADDTAYNATSWDANTDAATKNAIRDKFETLGSAGEANVQVDWNQTTDTEDDYIKNKPTIPTTATGIAFTPEGTISATNVQAAIQEVKDDAVSEAAGRITQTIRAPGSTSATLVPSEVAVATELALKQDVADAFDGAYVSLAGAPTIPTLTSDLTNDSGFLGPNPDIGTATGTALTVTGSLNVPAFTGTTYSGTDVAAGLQAALTEIDGAADVTATTYILTLFDDADAATARTTLGVDPIGTDNSDNNAVNTLYSGLVSNVTTTMDGITPGAGVVNALGNAVNGSSGVVVLAASPGTPDGTKVLRDDGTWVANGTVSSESSSYDFVYYDVQATDTGYIFRVPTGATPVWDTAYSWCDGAETALVYTVYYSATFGGTFSSLGTIAHNAAAETDSVDISSFTDPSAGGWLRVDITTPGTTASKCTLSIEVD